MVDGWKMVVTTANTWTNTQQENGFRCVCVCCICMCVGVVLLFFTILFIKAVIAGVVKTCHSPLLDQQDGYQHQQYKDENTSADPSDLHHPVRLFSGVRDDFWLLCSTQNIYNDNKTLQLHHNIIPNYKNNTVIIDSFVVLGVDKMSYYIPICKTLVYLQLKEGMLQWKAVK